MCQGGTDAVAVTGDGGPGAEVEPTAAPGTEHLRRGGGDLPAQHLGAAVSADHEDPPHQAQAAIIPSKVQVQIRTRTRSAL